MDILLLNAIKACVSILVVLGLSLIAERFSTKAAGMLAGFPTTTAITLFFIGLQVSPAFASESARYNLAGLVATQFFIYAYYRTSLTARRMPVLVSALAALLVYLLSISIIRTIDFNLWTATAFALICTLGFVRIFKGIKNERIITRARLGWNGMLLRAGIAASCIVTITIAPAELGAGLSGLLSAFPATILPTLLIVHLTYDTKHVHTIIKNVPHGMFSIIIFSVLISLSYPLLGIFLGTMLAFLGSTAYLMVYWQVYQRIRPAT